jgi:hypothetical protein
MCGIRGRKRKGRVGTEAKHDDHEVEEGKEWEEECAVCWDEGCPRAGAAEVEGTSDVPEDTVEEKETEDGRPMLGCGWWQRKHCAQLRPAHQTPIGAIEDAAAGKTSS